MISEESMLLAGAVGTRYGPNRPDIVDKRLANEDDVEESDQGWLPSKEATTTFKSVVGSGFFALPFAFQQAGLIGGLLVVGLVWFFTVWTTKQLVVSAATFLRDRPDILPNVEIGYVELGEAAFSSDSAYWISACVFASQYIAVCTYMVFLDSVLSPLVTEYASLESPAPFVRHGVLLVCVLIQFLLALAPNPSFLERTSNIGNAAFFLSVAFMFINGLMYSPPDFANNTESFHSVGGVYLCFGIASFTLSAHAECLSIFSTASSAAQERYPRVVESVTTVATLFYVAIAVFTYSCFGLETKEIVFENFTRTGGLLGAGLQVTICGMILCNYPLTLFPVHQMLESNLGLKGNCHGRLSLRQLASRAVLIALSGLVALVTGDHFGDISTIGGAFVGLVAFVLPPFIYIGLHGGWVELSRVELVTNLCIIAFGCFGSFQSLSKGVEDLIDSST